MADQRTWFLYLLRCSDGSFYTGIALDPQERCRVHNAGKSVFIRQTLTRAGMGVGQQCW